MKKIKYLLLVSILTLLTGCVKFNATMDIKKDKSMDFSIIYAFDTSLFGSQDLLEDSDKKELESQGFIVEDYNQNNMKGFTIKKSISNIDDVSSTSDTNYDISGLLNNSTDNNYFFKVKKGILKNTYIAKFKFDANESDLNTDESNDTSSGVTDDSDSINMDDLDLSSMTSNLDLSFNVKLPYSSISSNATTKNNDGKELTWNLSSNQEEMIEFEFELYNMTNIYIGAGILLVLIVIIIISILNKKKNKPIKEQVNNNVEQEPVVNNYPNESIQEVPNINPTISPITLGTSIGANQVDNTSNDGQNNI